MIRLVEEVAPDETVMVPANTILNSPAPTAPRYLVVGPLALSLELPGVSCHLEPGSRIIGLAGEEIKDLLKREGHTVKIHTCQEQHAERERQRTLQDAIGASEHQPEAHFPEMAT